MTSIVSRFCKNELPKSSSFASIGPHIWNNLSVSVRTQVTVDSFKSALKTHLFNFHMDKQSYHKPSELLLLSTFEKGLSV